jgi:flagellar biosynthetic protein FlhB
MAEDFETRTEAPTPRRRQQARDEGQVAYSQDLMTGLVVLAGAIGLVASAAALGNGWLTTLRLDLINLRATDLDADAARALLTGAAAHGLGACGLVLGLLFVVALAGGLLQVGVQLTPELLALKWERLLPFSGEPRLLSWNKLLRGLGALVKVAVLGLAAYLLLRGQGPTLSRLAEMRLNAAVAHAWTIVLQLLLVGAAILFLLGAADYFWQRWRLEQSLRMTRPELKEELKREEGDPLIRARIRRLQREAARRQMLNEVRRATVVVTNPTHLAIALRYDRPAGGAPGAGSGGVPRVVAKGAGAVAQRMVALARRHGLPVVERKTLAQALFRSVQVNQEIPAALYFAVAELLAYVYRLRGEQAA